MASFGRGFGRRFGSYIPGIADTISSLLIDNAKQEKKGLQLFNEKMAEERANMQKNVWLQKALTNPSNETFVEGLNYYSPNETKTIMSSLRPKQNTFKIEKGFDNKGNKTLEKREYSPTGDLVNREILNTAKTKLTSYVQTVGNNKFQVVEYTNGDTAKFPMGKDEKDKSFRELVGDKNAEIDFSGTEKDIKRLFDLVEKKDAFFSKNPAYKLLDPDILDMVYNPEVMEGLIENQQIYTLKELEEYISPNLEEIGLLDSIFMYDDLGIQNVQDIRDVIDEELKNIIDKDYINNDTLTENEVKVIGQFYRTVFLDKRPPTWLKNN